MNYRLGPFGFLSLRTPEFPGNMGLKDILLAMQWSYDNIHNFGGDKYRTTIYGISAGKINEIIGGIKLLQIHFNLYIYRKCCSSFERLIYGCIRSISASYYVEWGSS